MRLRFGFFADAFAFDCVHVAFCTFPVTRCLAHVAVVGWLLVVTLRFRLFVCYRTRLRYVVILFTRFLFPFCVLRFACVDLYHRVQHVLHTVRFACLRSRFDFTFPFRVTVDSVTTVRTLRWLRLPRFTVVDYPTTFTRYVCLLHRGCCFHARFVMRLRTPYRSRLVGYPVTYCVLHVLALRLQFVCTFGCYLTFAFTFSRCVTAFYARRTRTGCYHLPFERLLPVVPRWFTGCVLRTRGSLRCVYGCGYRVVPGCGLRWFVTQLLRLRWLPFAIFFLLRVWFTVCLRSAFTPAFTRFTFATFAVCLVDFTDYPHHALRLPLHVDFTRITFTFVALLLVSFCVCYYGYGYS